MRHGGFRLWRYHPLLLEPALDCGTLVGAPVSSNNWVLKQLLQSIQELRLQHNISSQSTQRRWVFQQLRQSSTLFRGHRHFFTQAKHQAGQINSYYACATLHQAAERTHTCQEQTLCCKNTVRVIRATNRWQTSFTLNCSTSDQR